MGKEKNSSCPVPPSSNIHPVLAGVESAIRNGQDLVLPDGCGRDSQSFFLKVLGLVMAMMRLKGREERGTVQRGEKKGEP